jgi:serine/threonine protein kinase
MLNAGDTIGLYKVDSNLGNGSFGEVYSVTKDKDPTLIALKVLTANDAENTTRFRNENDYLYKLKTHANVIEPVTKIINDAGLEYYCMEMADTNINNYLLANKIGITEALGLVKGICEGLKHAHSQGIVHRDLHPGNILLRDVNGAPTPKLTDFGMAKDFTGSDVSSIPMAVWGAIQYRAPEIFFMPWDDADQTRYIAADIYAIGIAMKTILDQRPVAYWTHIVNDIVQKILAHSMVVDQYTYQVEPGYDLVQREACYQEWLKDYDILGQDKLKLVLASTNSNVQDGINQLILRCCSPDYNNRYNDIESLMQDLDQIC